MVVEFQSWVMLPLEFLATEITKEDWFSFLLLCLKVSLMLAMLYNCLKF
jgi:hypothetical protein